MGVGLETVQYQLTAAAVTTAQSLTANGLQSAAIRASNGNAPIYLEDIWVNMSVTGALSVTSPRLHDNTHGILQTFPAATPAVIADEWFEQVIYSQDSLALSVTFPVAPGVVNEHACLQIYYTDLPGVAANLRTWAEVQPNIIEYVGVQTTPSSLAATGNWGAGVAFNSGFDLLKANQLYAVIGYTTSIPVTAVALQGPDTGNLLTGGPGTTNLIDTRGWFVNQSNLLGRPCIPVINSANKASTLAFVASTTAAQACQITWLCAHLSA